MLQWWDVWEWRGITQFDEKDVNRPLKNRACRSNKYGDHRGTLENYGQVLLAGDCQEDHCEEMNVIHFKPISHFKPLNFRFNSMIFVIGVGE